MYQKVTVILLFSGSIYTQNVEKVCALIRNSRTEIKIRALHCMSSLIRIDKDTKSKTDPVDQRITLMTREWFRSLNKELGAMEILFDICKNPFPDIQLAGLTLLDAVCQHQWGEEMVGRVAGKVVFL